MKDVKILEKRIGDKNQKEEKLGGIFFLILSCSWLLCTYLQCTTVGSTMPLRFERTRCTKSRKSPLSSGTPWSGQAWYCMCVMCRSELLLSCNKVKVWWGLKSALMFQPYPVNYYCNKVVIKMAWLSWQIKRALLVECLTECIHT